MATERHDRRRTNEANGNGWFTQAVNDMRTSEWWWSERTARILVVVVLVGAAATVAGFIVSDRFF